MGIFGQPKRLWRRAELPSKDEIIATSMLLGEPMPVMCSCCLGGRKSKGVFGKSTCAQCMGTGYDAIGRKTIAALKLPDPHQALSVAESYMRSLQMARQGFKDER